MTIIALPTGYSAPHGVTGSVASDARLLLPSPAVRLLFCEIEEATAGCAVGCAETVAMMLATSLAAPDLLADLPWREGVGRQPARLDLAQSQTFRIFARRWQPGQVGPLRRFMDWFAYGVAEGRLVELAYAEGHAPDHGDGDIGILPTTCQSDLPQGQVRHGPGDGQRLQRLANLSAEVALSLHVEGLPQMLTAIRSAVMPVPARLQPVHRPRPRLIAIRGGRTD